MERLDVEVFAEPEFTAFAQFQDFQLADFVSQRLARPGNVTVDFIDDVMFGFCRIAAEKVDRLVAAPTAKMNAGVDDQADRAPHVIGKLAESRIGILIQAQFGAETLAVQGPAFDKRGETRIAAKIRQVAEFLRECYLQMMAGHRLVHGQDFDFVFRSNLGPVQVYVIEARATAVRGRTTVIGSRRVRRRGRWNRLYPIWHTRKPAKQPDQFGVDAFARRTVSL